mmetsp:Transcript_1194/g.2391  ORF Transcript_1194/g.2391 Transcript_1194/m.2391 type:complete len:250 (+) Transcript_1194:974-1723(+)
MREGLIQLCLARVHISNAIKNVSDFWGVVPQFYASNEKSLFVLVQRRLILLLVREHVTGVDDSVRHQQGVFVFDEPHQEAGLFVLFKGLVVLVLQHPNVRDLAQSHGNVASVVVLFVNEKCLFVPTKGEVQLAHVLVCCSHFGEQFCFFGAFAVLSEESHRLRVILYCCVHVVVLLLNGSLIPIDKDDDVTSLLKKFRKLQPLELWAKFHKRLGGTLHHPGLNCSDKRRFQVFYLGMAQDAILFRIRLC